MVSNVFTNPPQTTKVEKIFSQAYNCNHRILAAWRFIELLKHLRKKIPPRAKFQGGTMYAVKSGIILRMKRAATLAYMYAHRVPCRACTIHTRCL